MYPTKLFEPLQLPMCYPHKLPHYKRIFNNVPMCEFKTNILIFLDFAIKYQLQKFKFWILQCKLQLTFGNQFCKTTFMFLWGFFQNFLSEFLMSNPCGKLLNRLICTQFHSNNIYNHIYSRFFVRNKSADLFHQKWSQFCYI